MAIPTSRYHTMQVATSRSGTKKGLTSCAADGASNCFVQLLPHGFAILLSAWRAARWATKPATAARWATKPAIAAQTAASDDAGAYRQLARIRGQFP